MITKGKFLRKYASTNIKVFSWLMLVTLLATIVLMGWGAVKGIEKSVFDMPVTQIGPVGDAVDEMDGYLDDILKDWGDAKEEDGKVVYNLAEAANTMKKEASLVNALDTAEAARRFANESVAEVSELMEKLNMDTTQVDEAGVSAEEQFGELVGALELLIAVVFAAFAIPAVLALLGFILKFDLLNLLALLVGAALTFLVHGAVLTVIVAVVLLAHFLMCRSINKAYRAFRRQN